MVRAAPKLPAVLPKATDSRVRPTAAEPMARSVSAIARVCA